jgi:hypothetical protein
LTEIADDPGQVRLNDLMIWVGRPEALGIKLLERLPRKFEAVLTCFWNFLRRVHGIEISLSAACKQAATLQPQLLEPVFHFLEMEFE